MRENKFKAWDTIGKYYWGNFITIQQDGIVSYIGESECWQEDKDNRFIIAFYTGLKTKEGIEICEGDIYERDSGDTYLIMWKKDGYVARHIYDSWIKKNILSQKKDGFLSMLPTFNIKLIGNIHENPELLK